jgi:hypothetical protein
MIKIHVVVVTLFSVAVLLTPVHSFAACTIEHLFEDSTAVNDFIGQSWTATCSGMLHSVTIKADTPNPGTHVLWIYSGQSIAPGDLLAQQDGITLADGDNTITITATVTITNGQQYTFILDNELDNQVFLRYASAGVYGGGQEYDGDNFSPGTDLWFQVYISDPPGHAPTLTKWGLIIFMTILLFSAMKVIRNKARN